MAEAKERPCTARDLARRFSYAKSEAEIRASFRRRDDPCPCIRSGGKRPIEKAFPSVLATWLLYEQGCADYAEVKQAARDAMMRAAG